MKKVICISAKAQNGKDTFAETFKTIAESNGEKVLIAHYADYLKMICKDWFGWDGGKDEHGRNILQKVGTDLARNNNPDIWVNVIIESILAFGSDFDYILMADSRFYNECDLIKDRFDTACVRITRFENDKEFDNGLTPDQKAHVSETALDDYKFDYYFRNDGVGEFRKRIEDFYLNDIK
jgi:hypothetical protein